MFDDLALAEQYGGELISSEEVEMASGYTNDGASEIVWYTLALEEPYQAAAGDWLGAAFEHYGGANVQVGEAQYTTTKRRSCTAHSVWYAYDWYYSNEVPMVRLNWTPTPPRRCRSRTLQQPRLELFPRSRTLQTRARACSSAWKAPQVTFELRDVTGKLVQQRDLGTFSRLQQLGGNAVCGAGSYTVTLIVDGARTTQKLMVK